MSQNSVASNGLSWESGTGYFGGGFVLFTALCNASKIQGVIVDKQLICGKTFQKETDPLTLGNPSDIYKKFWTFI